MFQNVPGVECSLNGLEFMLYLNKKTEPEKTTHFKK